MVWFDRIDWTSTLADLFADWNFDLIDNKNPSASQAQAVWSSQWSANEKQNQQQKIPNSCFLERRTNKLNVFHIVHFILYIVYFFFRSLPHSLFVLFTSSIFTVCFVNIHFFFILAGVFGRFALDRVDVSSDCENHMNRLTETHTHTLSLSRHTRLILL